MQVVKHLNQDVIKTLKKGGVIAYPTDTAYGLGASVNSLVGIKKIFKIKGRAEKKPVSILVSSFKQARNIAVFSKTALKLWQKFMPGALTLVLPIKPSLARSRNWCLLSANTATIGIRMPNHNLSRQIVKKLKQPITTTSANVSGQSSAYSAAEVYAQFDGRRFQPDIIIDGGKLKKGGISTIVDCTGGEVKILRDGLIKPKKILQVIQKNK